MAKGTVYEYFSSKDELVIEWVKQIGEEISANTIEAISGDETAEVKLQKYFDVKIKTFAIINPLLKFAIEKGHEATCEERAGVMVHLLALINRERELLHEVLEAGIEDSGFRKDLDIKSAAAMILSNVIVASLLNNDPEQVSERVGSLLPGIEDISVDSFLHLILNGLKD